MMWQYTRVRIDEEKEPNYFDGQANARILITPNVGQDRAHVAANEFEYNFTPEIVECYMRWYMVRMVAAGTIPPSFDDWPALDVIQFELGRYLYDFVVHPIVRGEVDIMDTSEELGFVVIKPLNDEGLVEVIWPTLNRLPMCPRRIDKKDAEQRAVQFLGARDLGE
jgi:hypothetical protein